MRNLLLKDKLRNWIEILECEFMAKSVRTEDYVPSKGEEFMGEAQSEFFRAKLEGWKADILAGSKSTISNLQEGSTALPDIVDRASAESDKALELRTRDRQRKLISKIDAALRRIDDGT